MPSLVAFLAKRFGISEDKVAAALPEFAGPPPGHRGGPGRARRPAGRGGPGFGPGGPAPGGPPSDGGPSRRGRRYGGAELMSESEGDDPHYNPTRRRLLRDLTGAGVGAAGVGLLGRELIDAAAARRPMRPRRPAACRPSSPRVPYYLDLDKVRRDITEGKAGLRLDLRIKVVDASSCKRLEDVAVEIWHADAGGTYSGFSQEGTAGKTYLRGVQLTGGDGVAQFRTVYPGWYAGRAIHVHMKAHTGGRAAGRTYRGGRTVHTGSAVLPRVAQREGGQAVAVQPPRRRANAQRRGPDLRAGRLGRIDARPPAQGRARSARGWSGRSRVGIDPS